MQARCWRNGLTLEEFRFGSAESVHGYFHDPQVAVALKEFEHPYFVAGGEVGHPGKYELRTDTSIMEAVQNRRWILLMRRSIPR